MSSDQRTENMATSDFPLSDLEAMQRELLLLVKDDNSLPTSAGLGFYLRRAVRIVRRQSSWDRRCR